MSPLDENEVVAAVCAALQGNGCHIRQRRHTTQQGVDVIAQHRTSGRWVYVEAKGNTSSREGSARFGRPYTQSQVFDRVAKGIFTARSLRALHSDRATADVVLAVPDTRWFRDYLGPVKDQLTAAAIDVYMVDDRHVVSRL